MIAGLLRRNKPSYLIKLSGTGILYDYPDQEEYLGLKNPKIYSDINDIDEITSRPAHAYHMYTDSIVRDAALKHGEKIKTAIVCPPDVYGRGHGPGRQLSWFIPSFVESVQRLGVSFYMKEGSNARGWVHIDDLTKIYVSLVEAAASGNETVSWGKHVSYCTPAYLWSIRHSNHTPGLLLSNIPRSITKTNR